MERFDVDYTAIAEDYDWRYARTGGHTSACFAPGDSETPEDTRPADAEDMSDWDEDGEITEWALEECPENVEKVNE